MNSKKWTKLALMLTTLLISSIVIFNVWLDPYGIAHKDKRRFITQPNLNYLKTHYIITHPDLYQNFIFGSSRVGNINPYYLVEPLFYNMTYPDAIPKETYKNIQRFLKAGVKIKTILLGLDEFSSQISYKKRQYQGLTRAYPSDSLLSWCKQYLFYFLKFPDKLDISVFKQRVYENKSGQIVGIEDQKKFFSLFEQLNKNINDNVVLHVKNPRFKKPTRHNDVSDNDPLADIQNIIALCHTNGINLIVFTNPIHHTNFSFFDKESYYKFKEELQKLTSFYDFSGPNTITENNYYFYEASHYRPIVGNYILDRIFFDKKFKDFGVYRPKAQ